MARTLDGKCRMCRRAGIKLFLKGDRCYTSKCAITKRNYPPGVSGAKQAKPRLTGFGIQLREKQKARHFYRVSEKQFSNYYKKATKKEGNTGELTLQMLESRLDNVIYRLGWTDSRDQARQFVGHGYFLVDGERVNIPSYQVKVGMIISLTERAKQFKYFQELGAKLAKKEVTGWLSGKPGAIEGKVVSLPTMEEIAPVFDMKAIIEFYSR